MNIHKIEKTHSICSKGSVVSFSPPFLLGSPATRDTPKERKISARSYPDSTRTWTYLDSVMLCSSHHRVHKHIDMGCVTGGCSFYSGVCICVFHCAYVCSVISWLLFHVWHQSNEFQIEINWLRHHFYTARHTTAYMAEQRHNGSTSTWKKIWINLKSDVRFWQRVIVWIDYTETCSSVFLSFLSLLLCSYHSVEWLLWFGYNVVQNMDESI